MSNNVAKIAGRSILFDEVDQPVGKPVTKFGGQPVWLLNPQWPISRQARRQMQFICQIRLSSLFDGMAYLFMTEQVELVDGKWQDVTSPAGRLVDETWDSEEGENAVIIQPGLSRATTTNVATGPSIYRLIKSEEGKIMGKEPCEFIVHLLDDASRVDDRLSDVASNFNRVGGNPDFIQNTPAFLKSGGWMLLMQIDSTNVPFYINFGDSGVGYVFISQDFRRGKFLWQCY
jgi:uncharacterized protein YwqG